ncbi:MAG: hypothetical protein AB8G05_18860 [Oligoflexales bacterium]
MSVEKLIAILTLAFTSLSGCDQSSLTSQFLDVKMLTVLEEPSYTSGGISCNDEWFEPYSVNFTLKNVVVRILDTSNGAVRMVDLYDDDPVSYRITNRIQKVFSKEISESSLSLDITGKVITGFWVTFAEQVTAKTKFIDSIATNLGLNPEGGEDVCSYTDLGTCNSEDLTGECSVGFVDPTEVIKGQGYSFVIKVQLKRTILRDTTADPQQELKFISPTMAISMTRT